MNIDIKETLKEYSKLRKTKGLYHRKKSCVRKIVQLKYFAELLRRIET
jgi:hypothetical protein